VNVKEDVEVLMAVLLNLDLMLSLRLRQGFIPASTGKPIVYLRSWE
jgi:hypothetical protein